LFSCLKTNLHAACFLLCSPQILSCCSHFGVKSFPITSCLAGEVAKRGWDYGTTFLDLVSSTCLSFAQLRGEGDVCCC
jgi:hypothetical protein